MAGVLNGTTTHYASGASYASHGGLGSVTLNGGASQWTESWSYNSRLRVTGMALPGMSLGYGYLSGDNGNVASHTIARGGLSWSQSFGYDGVNRLTSAVETGQANDWSQTYGYDAFGNRWVAGSPNYGLATLTPQSSGNFDGSNHLTGMAGGQNFDPAGNLTALGGSLTFGYDADGRMQSSTLSGLATTYAYDADGRRVVKQTGSSVATYVYDARGELALEVGGAAETACTTCYVAVDALGSTRATADATGAVKGCHDYLPFGEELDGVAGRSGSCWGAGETAFRFTSKERDPETTNSAFPTGLDYFGARYMSSAQGRFTSPDPKMFPHDITDPQSWNKYGYTRNNPLRYTDPDGEDWQDALKGGLNTFFSDNAFGAGRINSANSDFQTGQAIGDAVATVQGTVEDAGRNRWL